MLAVAYRRFTSAAVFQSTLLTSSNQASVAALTAGWSLWPLRLSTNSLSVRRAMILTPAL